MRCRGLFAIVMLLLLASCAPRPQAPSADISAAVRQQEIAPVVDIPEKEWGSLTAVERAAFASVGDFDRELTCEQQIDVLRYYRHLLRHGRQTVRESVDRAARYLLTIRRILWQCYLPLDLAYIPFVECNYDITVHPLSSHAMGLWQFIPSTATYYGMRRDAWTDQRRDPTVSTYTAAYYFRRLYRMFGDWHLAIAAYNAGEGKIGKAMAATGAKDFFELRARDGRITSKRLRMTQENRQYLPKFLAICKIMRNLGVLGFKPVSDPPDVTAVDVKPGVDLTQLAQAAGMTWETFLYHNAYFLRRFTPPGRTSRVVIPAVRRKAVEAYLREAPSVRSYDDWHVYTVRHGDTLRSIALRHGTSPRELLRVNQLDGWNCRRGVEILVPSVRSAKLRHVAGPVPPSHGYRVRSGDSLWTIARRTNVPIRVLMDLNGLTRSSVIRPGMVLRFR